MRIILFITMLSLAASATAKIEECREFTNEQRHIMQLAYSIGNQEDPELYAAIGDTIGYTMAAMVWQESFIDRYIIRWNSGDGRWGSYGVMMVMLSTAFVMDDIDNNYHNREKYGVTYITELTNNDLTAIRYGHRYLRQHMIHYESLWRGVRRYNGGGPDSLAYMYEIQEKVRELIRCGI